MDTSKSDESDTGLLSRPVDRRLFSLVLTADSSLRWRSDDRRFHAEQKPPPNADNDLWDHRIGQCWGRKKVGRRIGEMGNTPYFRLPKKCCPPLFRPKLDKARSDFSKAARSIKKAPDPFSIPSIHMVFHHSLPGSMFWIASPSCAMKWLSSSEFCRACSFDSSSVNSNARSPIRSTSNLVL